VPDHRRSGRAGSGQCAAGKAVAGAIQGRESAGCCRRLAVVSRAPDGTPFLHGATVTFKVRREASERLDRFPGAVTFGQARPKACSAATISFDGGAHVPPFFAQPDLYPPRRLVAHTD